MRIEREKIDNPLFGESIGEAKIGDAKISFPAPILTSTDINYATKITSEYRTVDISYPHKIHEIKAWYKKFAKKSETEKIGYINSQIGNACASSKSEVHIFTPLLAHETQITKSLIKSLVETQIKSELNVVNILDSPNMPLLGIKEIVEENSKKIRDTGKEPFFLTSMAQKKEIFEAKLNAVKETTNGITALYANPLKYYDNFSTMANMKNEERFLRIISNIERIYPKYKSGAVVPLVFLCADLFSPRLGVGEKKKKPKAKRLDANSLGYLTTSQHKQKYGEVLGCVCPIDEGNELSDLKIDYGDHLYEAFRVHEPFAISEIVEDVGHNIHNGRLSEFLKRKEYAQRPLKDLFHINLVDLTLI